LGRPGSKGDVWGSQRGRCWRRRARGKWGSAKKGGGEWCEEGDEKEREGGGGSDVNEGGSFWRSLPRANER